MLKILGGGTDIANDALYIIVFTLKQSFYKGQRRYVRHEAKLRLIEVCPARRLHIDGETHYVH